MIEARGLVKRYGSTLAVNDLSFSIRPGLVTGFLGPNGAGKTTTMRLILGLDAPTQGSVTVGGRSYRDLPAPMREVGALLDAKALHGGRRARDHLLCLAQSNGIPRRRVSEVLGIVGLEDVARRRVKGFSLGMGQRLGIAAALLGDPAVLIFDEPVNGLDPDGIHWVRTLLRSLAAKALVFAVVTFVVGEVTSFAAFFLGQALISGHAPHAVLSDPGVARAVVGSGLILAALAVLSVAVGTLLRHPAAAIAVMIAILFVLPGIAQALPDSWRNPVTEFWPTQAGSQLSTVQHTAHNLQPWPGFGVMCLFIAVVYALAWALLDRRDA